MAQKGGAGEGTKTLLVLKGGGGQAKGAMGFLKGGERWNTLGTMPLGSILTYISTFYSVFFCLNHLKNSLNGMSPFKSSNPAEYIS